MGNKSERERKRFSMKENAGEYIRVSYISRASGRVFEKYTIRVSSWKKSDRTGHFSAHATGVLSRRQYRNYTRRLTALIQPPFAYPMPLTLGIGTLPGINSGFLHTVHVIGSGVRNNGLHGHRINAPLIITHSLLPIPGRGRARARTQVCVLSCKNKTL